MASQTMLNSFNSLNRTKTMKKILLTTLLLPALASAEFLDDDLHNAEYKSPEKEQVELLEVRETSPYGSDNPLSVTIRNNSELYLDRVAIVCTITDQRGYRVFKDIGFQSKPSFSIRIDFPPVSTPELGIPPGAQAKVGLYTDDNRWTRGQGKYRYECEIDDVDGQE